VSTVIIVRVLVRKTTPHKWIYYVGLISRQAIRQIWRIRAPAEIGEKEEEEEEKEEEEEREKKEEEESHSIVGYCFPLCT
jgi:hypothetical protein